MRSTAVALALWSCSITAAASAEQIAEATFDDKMLALIAAVDSGSIETGDAVTQCVGNFAAESKTEKLRDVIAGFLGVPREAAFETGCGAVIRLLDTGEFSADDLRQLIEGKNARSKAVLSGQLLRALYFKHEAGA
ncbi:hypothetical protein [Pelagibius marinus]|uniref:hypothetical protein n=1 Tax=Pelagibius marinus TaxID=2762760 RepID=UPI001872B7B5|nr:hypothetical protein [Pelagibius marinus]